MLSNFLKNLSILKKFLFINSIFFTIIGLFTFVYLKNVQPNLIKKKSSNHIEVINNTIDNLTRLNVKFVEKDIRKFLFSTRFLFQNLDRVIFFDNKLNLIGDTDTLDLDPRSFSQRLDTIELEVLDSTTTKKITEEKNIDIGNENNVSLNDVLLNYATSKNFGIPFTFTEEEFNKFKLTTIKNVMKDGENIGYLAITENANGLRISCTRSVEKFSACEILFCNSKVISSKELESKPSSSFLNFNVSIFVFFVSLFFMILV